MFRNLMTGRTGSSAGVGGRGCILTSFFGKMRTNFGGGGLWRGTSVAVGICTMASCSAGKCGSGGGVSIVGIEGSTLISKDDSKLEDLSCSNSADEVWFSFSLVNVACT